MHMRDVDMSGVSVCPFVRLLHAGNELKIMQMTHVLYQRSAQKTRTRKPVPQTDTKIEHRPTKNNTSLILTITRM